MGADLFGKTGCTLENPAANPEPKPRNWVLGSDGGDQPTKSRRVGARCGETDEVGGSAGRDLRKQLIRLDPATEIKDVETVGLREARENLPGEFFR